MSLPVILRPEAEADVFEAQRWYEQRRAGLGEAFVEAPDQMLARIAAAPEIHEAALPDVRRGKLTRSPYVVYYRVFVDRIEVLGALHGSRDLRVTESGGLTRKSETVEPWKTWESRPSATTAISRRGFTVAPRLN